MDLYPCFTGMLLHFLIAHQAVSNRTRNIEEYGYASSIVVRCVVIGRKARFDDAREWERQENNADNLQDQEHDSKAARFTGKEHGLDKKYEGRNCQRNSTHIVNNRQITADDTLVFCCDARTVVVRNENDLATLVGVRDRKRIVFCNNILAHAATQKTRKDGLAEHFTGKKSSGKKPDDETRDRKNRKDDGQERTDKREPKTDRPNRVPIRCTRNIFNYGRKPCTLL